MSKQNLVNTPPKYMSIPQAASYFGLNENTLRKRCALREVPVTKLGRNVLLEVEKFSKWLEGHSIDPVE